MRGVGTEGKRKNPRGLGASGEVGEVGEERKVGVVEEGGK